jgi:hypothetical protein
VVDPVAIAAKFHGAVGMVLPGLAPQADIFPRIPPTCFHRIKALRRGAPQGQHDVRMVVALVAAFGRAVPGNIGHHAPADKLLLHKGCDQIEALGVGHLERQRHIDLAGELRVLALVQPFHLVPQA